MSQPSFKSMTKDGTVKRADAMKVRLEDIHEEPGFNLRIENEEFQASIDTLAQHIIGGGQYPALEVRPRQEGGVWIVDGHRRHKAIRQAIEHGTELADKDGQVWVNVVPFTGNDADRVARIMTSAEGRGLSPLETAQGYKRLAAFGWEPERIAKTVGKTRQHVDQLLILANAPSAVHDLVKAGAVSAAVAVTTVRDYGDNAGQVLGVELDKAKAQGKKKVTAGTMKPKALPRDVVDNLGTAVDNLLQSIHAIQRETIEGARDGTLVGVNALKLKHLFTAFAEVEHHQEAQAKRLRDQAANENQTDIEESAA